MREKHLGRVDSVEDVLKHVEDYKNKGYKVLYVGKTTKLNKRLKEYKSGIGDGGSTALALLRSVVKLMNEVLPFDNILRTYINTGVFLYAESAHAKNLEEELISKLNPQLNQSKGDQKGAKYVYIFMHKYTPQEFLEEEFPEIEQLKDYILKRCFELNLEALPYEEELETDKMRL